MYSAWYTDKLDSKLTVLFTSEYSDVAVGTSGGSLMHDCLHCMEIYYYDWC